MKGEGPALIPVRVSARYTSIELIMTVNVTTTAINQRRLDFNIVQKLNISLTNVCKSALLANHNNNYYYDIVI